MDDTVHSQFVEYPDKSPTFTRWFPQWAWVAHSEEDGWLWFEWAIARWKVVSGSWQAWDHYSHQWVHLEDRQLVTREWARMTPGNIHHHGIAINSEALNSENIR